MDPMFDKAVIDRVERCVKRDKNAPCILIWSLGNESGYGNSFEKAGRWVKAYDPTRLTHYEGAVYEAEGHVNDTSMIDLYSRMYPHVEWIDEYFADPGNKSLILCVSLSMQWEWTGRYPRLYGPNVPL